MHISKRTLNYSKSLNFKQAEALPDIYAPGVSEYSNASSVSHRNRDSSQGRAVSYSIYGSGPGPGKYSR